MSRRILAFFLFVILLVQSVSVFSESIEDEKLYQTGEDVQIEGTLFADDKVIIRMKAGNDLSTKEFSTSENEVNSSLYGGLEIEKVESLNILKQKQNMGIQSIEMEQDIRALTLKNKGREEVVKAVNLLNTLADIDIAEPDYIFKINDIPNDPNYNSLYGMNKISASEAWEQVEDCSHVLVGIVDTGIDIYHEDLSGNIWSNPNEIVNGIDDDGNGFIDDIHGWNFIENNNDITDLNSHGTHVAGTIGAVGNNGIGVAGVARNAKLIGLRFLDASGSGYDSNAIKAIEYANHMGISITNNSYGGGEYSQIFRDVIAEGNSLFVASAGNDSSDNDHSPIYPASYDCDNIISVASTDSADHLSYFSNYGYNTVHIAAPGSNILSTIPGNKYGEKSGTSMASPHVVGAAALIKAYNKGISAVEIKDRIIYNSDSIEGLKRKTFSGGRINAYKALFPVVNVPLERIDLDKNDLTLKMREKVILQASFYPENATKKRVTWSSSNNNVVQVSSIGTLIGVGNGSAVVTVTSCEDQNIKAECIVAVSETEFTIDFKDMNFKQAVIDNLKEYSSQSISDDAYMYFGYTINSNLYQNDVQKLRSLNIRNRNIRDVSGIEQFTSLLSLDCSYNAIASLDVSMLSYLNELNCSDNAVSNLDFNENNSWKNLNLKNNYLDVSDQTDLKAKIDILESKTEHTEYLPQNNYVPIQELKLNYASDSIGRMSTLQLTANITPVNVSNKDVVWMTDNPEVATVTSGGLVKTKAAGTVNITATPLASPEKAKKCSITVNSNSNIPIDFIDDNFKQEIIYNLRSLNTKYNSYTTNSNLYPEDMASLTALTINSLDVTDATELGYCSSLTNLDIMRSQVSYLDLKQLKSLVKVSVVQSSKLTYLDASKLPNLTSLSVFGSLKGINIIGCSVLDELNVSSNYLTELDLKGLVSLRSLRCNQNNIKVIDIMDCVNIQEIYLYDNLIESIDLRGLSQLTLFKAERNKMINLKLDCVNSIKTFSCYDNYLNISNGSELSNILVEMESKGAECYFLPQKTPEASSMVSIFPKLMFATNEQLNTLSATVKFDYAEDKTIEWESLNPDIVQVDDNGIVTVLKSGVATVRALLKQDPSIYSESKVYARNTIDDGKGTQESPYILRTKEDILFMNENSNSDNLEIKERFLNYCYELLPQNGGFIDMEGIEIKPIGPCRSGEKSFSGIFDGNNKEIRNFKINVDVKEGGKDFDNYDGGYVGFFSCISDGIVKNLTLNGSVAVNIIPGSVKVSSTGILVGNIRNCSSMINCHVFGSVSSGANNVGGLIGNADSVLIQDCSSNVTVNGNSQVGGLIGTMAPYTSVYNSYAAGNVYGSKVTGGLIGFVVVFQNAKNHKIYNCYSSANVKAISRVGGFIGACMFGNINNCFSSGNVDGDTQVAGFIGYADIIYVKNCFTTSDVTGTGNTEINGFCNSVLYGSNNYYKCYKYDKQVVTGNTFNDKIIPFVTYTDLISGSFITNLLGTAYQIDSGTTHLYPKLYKRDTNELVPYQADTYFMNASIINNSKFNGNVFDISITLDNTNDLTSKYIISALYFSNGRLADVSFFPVNDEISYTKSIQFDSLPAGEYIQKIMIWNDLQMMVNYGNVITQVYHVD